MFTTYIHIKFQITACNVSSVTAIKTKAKHTCHLLTILQQKLFYKIPLIFLTWRGSSKTPEQIGHTSSSSTSPWNRFTSKPILCRPEMDALSRTDYLPETKFMDFQLCFRFNTFSCWKCNVFSIFHLQQECNGIRRKLLLKIINLQIYIKYDSIQNTWLSSKRKISNIINEIWDKYLQEPFNLKVRDVNFLHSGS